MQDNKNININHIEMTGEIRNEIKLFDHESANNAQFQIEYTNHELKTKRTNIFPCVAWNEMADDVCKRFKKGDKIYISGKLISNNYTYPSGDISYGVQIWLDVCEPIDILNKTENYNVDDFCSEQEIVVGDDVELYHGKPLPF